MGQFTDSPQEECQDFEATNPFGTKTCFNLIIVIDGKFNLIAVRDGKKKKIVIVLHSSLYPYLHTFCHMTYFGQWDVGNTDATDK